MITIAKSDLNRLADLEQLKEQTLEETMAILADTDASLERLKWFVKNAVFKTGLTKLDRQMLLLEILMILDAKRIYGDTITALFKQAGDDPEKAYMLVQGIGVPKVNIDEDNNSSSVTGDTIISTKSMQEIIEGDRIINWARLKLSIKITASRHVTMDKEKAGFEGTNEEFLRHKEKEEEPDGVDEMITQSKELSEEQIEFIKEKLLEVAGISKATHDFMEETRQEMEDYVSNSKGDNRRESLAILHDIVGTFIRDMGGDGIYTGRAVVQQVYALNMSNVGIANLFKACGDDHKNMAGILLLYMIGYMSKDDVYDFIDDNNGDPNYGANVILNDNDVSDRINGILTEYRKEHKKD